MRTVQSDGSFHLTTFATRDGAPVGDFALTVTWPGPRVKGQGEDEPGPDRLQQRYARSEETGRKCPYRGRNHGTGDD